MSANWLHGLHHHADPPDELRAMPVFEGQKLVVQAVKPVHAHSSVPFRRVRHGKPATCLPARLAAPSQPHIVRSAIRYDPAPPRCKGSDPGIALQRTADKVPAVMLAAGCGS